MSKSLREAAQRALEAHDVRQRSGGMTHLKSCMVELRAALAAEDGEPMAWGSGDGYWVRAKDKSLRPDSQKFSIAFYTAPQPADRAQRHAVELTDSSRMDWLCLQFVTVRIPLRYGSAACFAGSPDDSDGGGPIPWDIRAAIDEAIAADRTARGGAA